MASFAGFIVRMEHKPFYQQLTVCYFREEAVHLLSAGVLWISIIPFGCDCSRSYLTNNSTAAAQCCQ